MIASSAHAAQRPNIVLTVADDMGYGDLGCYGHPVAKTPHIDDLAKQGVRFTQHYANGPECSPTRTALLTGRYQQRVGGLECAIGTGNVGRYDDAIRLAENGDLGLPAEPTVIPSALKDAGYTCGIFGKWHLGYEAKFNPLEHRWDEFFGYLGGNVHYFNHRETSDLHVLYRGRKQATAEGYMTHLITDASIDFIERHRDEPFFLFVSHECPHFPFQGPGDSEKVVNEDNWTTPDADAYVAMLEDLDSEVGRLLAALDKQRLADDTLVVFVSDNGGFAGAAHMGPLRGAKSTTFEGGIRVPLIIRWPGQIAAGAECNQVSATFDLTRSFLELGGAKVSSERLDGYDIIDHVVEQRDDFSRTLFWRGRRGERTWWAVRDGDWKYVRQTEDAQSDEWLFNLAGDLGEQHDRLDEKPAETSRLKELLRDWETEVKPQR
ncbi:MAG: sulfatase-like hydrolase/transferase [Candidatus Paceibacterota bacterium]